MTRNFYRFLPCFSFPSVFYFSFMDLNYGKDFLKDLAAGSGEIIRGHWFGDAFDTERKSDDTPVTVADRETEEFIRLQLQKTFPDHGIIGEEYPNAETDSDYVWVVDPIDGTKSFISHVPLFGTLVALLYKKEPVLGMIHQPILQELMIGDNETTTLNGEKVRIRECKNLSDATLVTTDPNHFDKAGGEKLRKGARLTRCWGDCYGYLLLASGRIDVMFDPIMEPWDILPLVACVRGAGATITGWDGGNPAFARSGVAAGPDLHPEVQEILASSL